MTSNWTWKRGSVLLILESKTRVMKSCTWENSCDCHLQFSHYWVANVYTMVGKKYKRQQWIKKIDEYCKLSYLLFRLRGNCCLGRNWTKILEGLIWVNVRFWLIKYEFTYSSANIVFKMRKQLSKKKNLKWQNFY